MIVRRVRESRRHSLGRDEMGRSGCTGSWVVVVDVASDGERWREVSVLLMFAGEAKSRQGM